MARATLRIDTSPLPHLLIGVAVFFLLLLVGLIVGVAGPSTYIAYRDNAYKCPDGSHIWSAACKGAQLGGKGAMWSKILGPITPRNRFWSLSMTPYRNAPHQNNTLPDPHCDLHLTLQLNISWRSSNVGAWHQRQSDTTTHTFHCAGHPQDSGSKCETLDLLMDQSISSGFYRVTLVPLSASGELGDIDFTETYGNENLTTMEIVLSLLFMLSAMCGFLLLLFLMRRYDISDLHWEQLGITILMLALIFFNNPFLAFQFLIPSWFFVFLGSLFKTVFFSLLLLFWLLYCTRIHDPAAKVVGDWLNPHYYAKLAAIAAFFLLSTIAFTWLNIRDAINPIFADESEVTGAVVFRVFSGVAAFGILIWSGVLVGLSYKTILSSKDIKVKLLILGIPTIVVALTMVIGIWAGGNGVNNHHTFEFAFFGFLYNSYMILLLFFFMPVNSAIGRRQAEAPVPGEEPVDETTGFVSHPSTTTPTSAIVTTNDDEEEAQ